MTVATIAVPGYRLDRMLGRGGFGIVWLATREADGRRVAVKVLHRVMDPTARRRFDDEIQIMGTLAWHPNIVRIIDAGTVQPLADAEAGQAFIAMEYLAGGSLGQRLSRFGPAPVPDVIGAGVQAATGLQVAHNAGLLHRDVKPDNLLVGEEETVKVSDFGIAVAAAGSESLRGATGTLAYSAPELLGGGVATRASDVYALGATLYALLTGEPAFHRGTDESPAAMILRAYTQPVPDLRDRGVPTPVAHVIERAMAKEPGDRPPSAEALGVELAGAAVRLGLPSPTPVPAGRRRDAGDDPTFRPSAEERAKVQRLSRLTRRVGAIAMAVIAVAFISVSTFTGQSSQDGAVAPGEDAVIDAGADEDAVDEEAVDEPAPTAAATPAPQQTPFATAQPTPIVPDELPAPAPAPPPPATGGPLPSATTPGDGEEPALEPAIAPFLTGAAPQLVAADGERRYAYDGRQLVAFDDADGRAVASTEIAGLVDLVASGGAGAGGTGAGGVTGLLADGRVVLFTAGLEGRALDLGARAIAADGLGVVAATEQGVVRLDPSGRALLLAEVDAARIGAGGGVVWVSTTDGAAVAVDGDDGQVLAQVPLTSAVRSLAVTGEGMLVLASDDGIVRLDPDGMVRTISPAVASDVAVDGDTIYALVARQFGVVGPGELFVPLDLGAEATSLAVDDLGPVVGLADPPSVVRPGG